ncbi:hypothetical protein [Micromonospora sp. NPDC049645]|uniref:hypothetical protein n=1 Tax=Micromonospora sp. NPDC049645 TaxID=3155508 RepID=UPI0034166776
MKPKRLYAAATMQLFAFLLVIASVVATSSAPASAASKMDPHPETYSACQEFAAADYLTAIGGCNYIDWVAGPSSNTIQHSGYIKIGPNATSATGCKVTAYVTINFVSTWTTPKVTRDCTNALTNRSAGVSTYFWGGQTSGTSGIGQMCIDLYYNNSSSSGWQRCRQTGVSQMP